MLHCHLKAACVLGGVNGGMGLIGFVSVSWIGPTPVQDALCKSPPLIILRLLLHQGGQVEVFWENVGLSTGIADKPDGWGKSLLFIIIQDKMVHCNLALGSVKQTTDLPLSVKFFCYFHGFFRTDL